MGSGEEYVPLNKMPVMGNVFMGISIIGGFLMTKWLGFLIGVLFSFLYASLGLKGKNGAMIGAFVGWMCTDSGCADVRCCISFGNAGSILEE